MNRNIEFRGLDVTNKWRYGYLLKTKIHYFICTPKSMFASQNYNIEKIETIGQYTGLKDKNGKKIFEGDIVKYDNDYIKQIGVIEWNDKNSSFQIKGISSSSMTHLKRMIVIGNIYENKELLED